uniref:Bifunctional lysine-specific demethylase and histidyl-hydroxylase n=1 Tax=Grammatophora oceanica TaxID=210454 RepID=A0A7S1Y1A8_9STRA|mmetsp:Transcript_14448/g.21200  ORF Transcript_14448/g.21200 Transcript_14448/m.21200 type:complete len:428 (+) Transcript_14448:187-1470(+)|eukprot:CAMPEP_0194057210 /NCGR_PEP_ID=MMETSP0009_2-20130614/62646_1 /TAXON_ID=210454 /ORGANISM="Grammatophora oceanica, Strain CCMP 410" /LENGTH=427 /DNA_ID=CAMNT_0038706875 /DNA_START=130 /DNA_END=1413 /DNA_ORIENTATION=-
MQTFLSSWMLHFFFFLAWTAIVTLPGFVDGHEDEVLRPDAPLTLLDSLFPHDSFLHAYETSPLLSRRIADGTENAGVESSDHHESNNIRSVALPPDSYVEANGQQTSAQDVRLYQVNNLFQSQYLDHIFRQPNLEYKLVKKVVRDGEEWLGIMPHERVSTLEDAVMAHHAGFTLVVDKLQNHWPSISEFARELEVETQQTHVSCNLYMTPPNRSGFESHWDWMDVIVLQLAGQKTWSVASEPTVYLSNEELKYKPSLAELNETSWYDTFVLNPGDVLYIPRGHLHNASTVGFLQETSLHLTFGIESTSTSVASLIVDTIKDDHQLISEYLEPIQKLEQQIGGLRQSVTFHPSFQKRRPLKQLFEDGVESIAENLGTTEASNKFRQVVNERYDIGVHSYRRREKTRRMETWEKESAALKARMEAIGAR